jgi:hypothetical protein
MRAWIDRTNDGLSGMPADGISLPPKKGDFGTSRWGGSKVRLHHFRKLTEGGHGRSWHIAAPDVCDGTSAVGEGGHQSHTHPLVNPTKLA